MNTLLPQPASRKIVYPESDGEPIAENTLQFRWIVTVHGGVSSVFKDNPKVFVGADLLWYPVEGDPKTRMAPDVMVAIGRPKGERGSYLQWREEGIAPQVVFEVLSPGNRIGEMLRKLQFYERFGVEEYYIYDPDRVLLEAFIRNEGKLVAIEEPNGWHSPRLGIRFDMGGDELVIYGPDNRRFLTFEELTEDRDKQERLVEEERLARLQAQDRADKEKQRAELEKQRADKEKLRADCANERELRLIEQLRKLSAEPEAS